MGNPGSPGVPFAGDPVNLATGQFIYAHTDLIVNDIVPLKLRRIYVSDDAGGADRPFGWNMSSGMDYQLNNPVPSGANGNADPLLLGTPDGGSVSLTCISICTQFQGAVYQAQTPGYFYQATMQFVSGSYDLEWVLTTKDGTNFVFFGNGGRIKYIQDRNGNQTQFLRSLGEIGSLTAVVSPNGKSIELAYTEGLITSARDNSGRTWTYAYNFGRMISATDPMGGVWQYTYDSDVNNYPNMLTVQDPRGNTVVTNEYTYGLVTKQTYADGSTNSFVWTQQGDLPSSPVTQVSITDRRGNVRQVVFNPAYYVSSDTFAVGLPESQTTTYTRDPATNLLVSKTDPLGRVTSYTYDAKGNGLTVTRLSGTPNAVTTTYTYEPTFNQIATVTDPLGHMTSYTHDALGNLTQVLDANNNVKTMSFTSQGQVATITDALMHTTSLGYDAGVLTNVTDPLGRSTSLSIDALGRISASSDPSGNVTQIDYNALDHLTKVIDPLGNAGQLGYDANGNLLSYTDPLGNSTSYTYDAMNRVTNKTDALLNSEAYTYDIASKLNQVTDRKGQVSGMTYDALNRRTSIGFGATTAAPTGFDSTISNTFDSVNRLTQAVDSQNGPVVRSYDGLNRLLQEQTSQGIVSYTYDAAGRRTSMTVANQQAVTYAYDSGNRWLQIQQGSQSIGFTYDAANRRTQTSLPNGTTINYAYDSANQLISITYMNGTLTLGDLNYAYDGSGRRVGVTGSFARTALPAAIASATYNANNQLTQWAPQTLAYDLNGNLIGDGTYTYVWDSRNHLAQIKQGANVVADYWYDAYGRRRQKTVTGITTQYLYDGRNSVQELSATGVVRASLMVGLALDEVYSRTEGGATSSFLTDQLGGIIAEVDGTGTVQTTYTYEPYGATTQNGPPSDNSQRYTSREQDFDALYYYRARYYSTLTNRFISEDPIGLKGGFNSYLYVRGNPVSKKDPRGLAPWCDDFSGECYLDLDPQCIDQPGGCQPFGDEWELCCDKEGDKCRSEAAEEIGHDVIGCALNRLKPSECVSVPYDLLMLDICLFKHCHQVPKGTCRPCKNEGGS